MSRRDALKRLAGLFGSAVIASTFLAACAPPAPTATPAPTAAPPTIAPTGVPPTAAPPTAVPPTATAAATATPATLNVVENDPAIDAMAVSFPSGSATILGYLAKPKGNGPFPVVLICHENRGLLPHIQDVTRRYGKAGYVAIGVDLLSRAGGTDKVDAAAVPGALGAMTPAQIVEDFKAANIYAQTLAYVRKDRTGMVGYCFGGGVTWRVAGAMKELRAAVPYYGSIPPVEEVPNIQAAVLALYGETDTRINAGIPTIEAAMKQNNKTFEKMVYPNAGHAFNNDTGASHNAAAARDAFTKSLAWFEKYLKA